MYVGSIDRIGATWRATGHGDPAGGSDRQRHPVVQLRLPDPDVATGQSFFAKLPGVIRSAVAL